MTILPIRIYVLSTDGCVIETYALYGYCSVCLRYVSVQQRDRVMMFSRSAQFTNANAPHRYNKVSEWAPDAQWRIKWYKLRWVQWRWLQRARGHVPSLLQMAGHGGTCPHFYKWLGTGTRALTFTNGWARGHVPSLLQMAGHGGTCPHFYKWLGTGGTKSRWRAYEKLTKLYWPSRKRSPKRHIVLVEPQKGRATT